MNAYALVLNLDGFLLNNVVKFELELIGGRRVRFLVIELILVGERVHLPVVVAVGHKTNDNYSTRLTVILLTSHLFFKIIAKAMYQF